MTFEPGQEEGHEHRLSKVVTLPWVPGEELRDRFGWDLKAAWNLSLCFLLPKS